MCREAFLPLTVADSARFGDGDGPTTIYFRRIRRRGVNVSSGHVGHYQNHALSERGKALIETADLGVMAGIQEAADF